MGQALFGAPPKDIKEVVRENQRAIKKAVRDIDKEIRTTQTSVKKLEGDIKKNAKQGNMSTVRIMAKDLVRQRKFTTRFIEMKAHLTAVSLKMQTIKSHEAMATAMKGVTKSLAMMNKQFNMPAMNKIMQEFMKENEMADLTQEMIGDTIDDAMEEEGSVEEEEKIVSQILDELGINAGESISAAGEAPKTVASSPVEDKAAAPDPAMAELEARLNNLRNG